MATTSVLGTVYETLLCSPGMNEAVKLDVKISRKAVLLLNSIIQGGVDGGDAANKLLELVPPAELQELRNFAEEGLQKAGLAELAAKIRSLQA